MWKLKWQVCSARRKGTVIRWGPPGARHWPGLQILSPNCAAPLNHLWRSPGLMGEGHAFIVQVRPEPGPEFQKSVHCFLRPCCLLVASSIEWSQYFILFYFSGNKTSILNNDKWSITFKSVNQYVIHIITYDYILLYINYTTIKNNKKETLVTLGRQLHRQVNYQFVRTPTFVSHMLSMYVEILCCQTGLSEIPALRCLFFTQYVLLGNLNQFHEWWLQTHFSLLSFRPAFTTLAGVCLMFRTHFKFNNSEKNST